MKKILIIAGWAVLGIALILTMGFAVRVHGERLCEKVDIVIDRSNADLFIQQADVEQLLAAHHASPQGQPISSIDIPALEKLLLTHPAVQTCEVFMAINGNVTIHIHQRRVIARFINQAGETYYADDRGFLMPWSEEYTAPVVLVNGEITDSYAGMYNKCLDTMNVDSVLVTKTKLDDAWQLVKKIDADTFLRAQIVQLYFSKEKGIVLVPRVGDHSIIFGDAADIGEKFRKLLVFYREGLDRTGRWNEYASIDLQYKNQVVCTKKTK
jgi:cell division protein FtsQ